MGAALHGAADPPDRDALLEKSQDGGFLLRGDGSGLGVQSEGLLAGRALGSLGSAVGEASFGDVINLGAVRARDGMSDHDLSLPQTTTHRNRLNYKTEKRRAGDIAARVLEEPK